MTSWRAGGAARPKTPDTEWRPKASIVLTTGMIVP